MAKLVLVVGKGGGGGRSLSPSLKLYGLYRGSRGLEGVQVPAG